MKSIGPFAIVLFFPVLCVAALAQSPPRPRDLSVARHSRVGNLDANRTLREATGLLQRQDRQEDISCRVELRLSGELGTFEGKRFRFIQTEADLLTLLQDESHIVKVVEGISGSLCNGQGRIRGCADRRGIVIVARAGPNVWAHEVGHFVGLVHRSVRRELIMHRAGGKDEVNVEECAAF